MNVAGELSFDYSWRKIEDLHYHGILTDADLEVLAPMIVAATGSKIAVFKLADRLDKTGRKSDV